MINYGECIYIIEREQGLEAAHKAIAAIDQLPVKVEPVNRERAFEAAHVKAHYAVSFADAFAAALALENNAKVVTGDPEFREVESLVQILWLPR